MKGLNSLVELILSADAEVSAQAGCDLAQKIWNGELSDKEVAELTQHSSDAVRETIAWAVWDAQRPSVGIDWLLTNALADRSALVRTYAVAYIQDAIRGKDLVRVLSVIHQMQDDPSPIVRDLVNEILKTQEEGDD